MNQEQRKQSILERLKHSLQALALPAQDQVAYFPDFVVKTDELVLDFDHWRDCAVGNYQVDMTAAQLDSLAAVDAYIAVPNSTGDRTVWDESALYSHPFWEELRNLAIQSLTRSVGCTNPRLATHTSTFAANSHRCCKIAIALIDARRGILSAIACSRPFTTDL